MLKHRIIRKRFFHDSTCNECCSLGLNLLGRSVVSDWRVLINISGDVVVIRVAIWQRGAWGKGGCSRL
jgi:hypothetical protein